MHAFLSLLTAGTLAIHALLGCCWHRVQPCTHGDCVTASDSQATVSDPQGKDCCKHQHDSKGPSEKRSGPCECQFECQGVCTFLPSQKTMIEASPLVIPFSFVAFAATLTDGRWESTFRWEPLCGFHESEPSLRLHLLHQMLLI